MMQISDSSHGDCFSFTKIYQLVEPDFDAANSLIEESLHADVPLVQSVCQHIIHSGGKRLRPLVALLAAKAVCCQNNRHIPLAVVVEFLHTATLLHDDVVDASQLRRGQKTANTIWGNSASVLVGDFLYSRAFQLMSRLESLAAYTLLADATNVIAQGEVLQLIHSNHMDMTEAAYLEVIRCKTATLFSAAARCSVVVAEGNAIAQKALADYGLHLGIAFQMIDDWMDYAISSEESGKNRGDDLAEGKVTLPLIYAMRHGSATEKKLIQTILKEKDESQIEKILEILHSTNTAQYIFTCAQTQSELAKTALSSLPDSVYKKALIALTDLALQRRA